MEAEITIKINPPKRCTEEQFREWLEFNFHLRGGISLDNPLHEYEPDHSNYTSTCININS